MAPTDTPTRLFEEFAPVPFEEWKNRVAKETGVSSVDEYLEWTSIDGASVPSYLTREALDPIPHADSNAPISPLGATGEIPANSWTICQLIDHPDPETANQRARKAVQSGVSHLKLMAANAQCDGPDLSVVRSADLPILLEGIDLRQTGIHLGGDSAALVLYAALRQHLDNEEVDPAQIRGSVEYDPVAACVTDSVSSVDRAFDLAEETVEDARELENFRTLTVDTAVYHEAGASAVQELAFALGTLTERLARAAKRGTALTHLLDNLQFRVPVSTSYFVEIAKLRALRLLVPQVIEPFMSATDGETTLAPYDLHVHAETSRRTETVYDPYSNMLRGTTEALAATVGGCDVLTVRRYDASLRPSDEFGSRIARNTQLVLRHEAHADQVADPAAGSYFVEALTDRLGQNAWDRFQELEANGGILEGLRMGEIQTEIEETRRERLDALDRREQVLVGTSHYPNLDERRLDDVSSGKSDGTKGPVGATTTDVGSLGEIRQILDRGASIGEVAEGLRGENSAVEPLPAIRLSENVELLRLRTETYAESNDGAPRVLLVPMGPPSARSARANFARNFLGVGGFRIDEPLKFETVDEAAEAAQEKDVDVVVLCSSNDQYMELSPALRSALKKRNQDAIFVVAGSPSEISEDVAADFFIHSDSSLMDTLEGVQSRLGMSVPGPTPDSRTP